MEGITSSTIPSWFVSIMLILTGLMWVITRRREIRMDSRIFTLTLIVTGSLYGIVFQLLGVDEDVREFVSRLVIVLLCMSQFLPLTISFTRSIKRGY